MSPGREHQAQARKPASVGEKPDPRKQVSLPQPEPWACPSTYAGVGFVNTPPFPGRAGVTPDNTLQHALNHNLAPKVDPLRYIRRAPF